MKRSQVNPWDWSSQFGFSQGELVEGGQRVLFCAGQAALDENAKPQHEGDLRAQTTLALDNLDAVLKDAGMTLSNVVRLKVYTTGVDLMIQNYDVLVGRLAAAGIKPAQTLLGVNRLAFPELLVEIEATAVA
jgi:enamine deaminase RidA (YjgF/YER057c/UK114 family)